ncbi:hypothetical protein SKTS_18190 [Sulfurimicrobium lacus]|uniref:Methyltransferase domain-containing protein n=1 Tax=Sulfurimicrobium lacus TaxID=2715678 RepID=A0A6F8VAR1_9PROT|nr:class I SAM-dependent methyltransferase [Sulfurimicrobium lacus]BCB26933.1 hypothetical protein SKTS_18190 [Sulfurimicrobium lacus]
MDGYGEGSWAGSSFSTLKITPHNLLLPEYIQQRTTDLALAAKDSDWCPNGGWQFPFDFGHGIIAPTYTPVQQMHPWRRDMLVSIIQENVPANYADLSVLDLGAGEGAMAVALWAMGFREITCVENRPLNIEKAQFACEVYGAKANFVHSTVDEFLSQNDNSYDIVIFMGLLYHVLNPFEMARAIGRVARHSCISETVIAQPRLTGFDNRPNYQPSEAAFYIRVDSTKSHTAGIYDLELWPTEDALITLFQHGGFNKVQLIPNKGIVPPDFQSGGRRFAFAKK